MSNKKKKKNRKKKKEGKNRKKKNKEKKNRNKKPWHQTAGSTPGEKEIIQKEIKRKQNFIKFPNRKI